MSNEAYKGTVRLTVAQAIIRFLSNQYSERDGAEHRLIAGAFGIFGHGNVAGIGQALLQNEIAPAEGENPMPYIMPRNEQGAVHAAAAFAKTTNRLQTWMTTASIGPGSLNMVTGAALATTNRLPVLVFPSDQFATRTPDPVLQQLEDPTSLDVSVNDAFRPVSRFFDRINRPEQLIPSLLCAMRVLTDPAETGAVTIAMPQDVQAEVFDWPVEFFRKRVWHVRRPVPEPAALQRAVSLIKSAKRPLIIAGGGTIYAGASDELRALADTIEDQLVRADVLITTGGLSVGQGDTVKDVLAPLGSVRFDAVAMSPGRQLGVGTVEGTPIFCLPGDPVSAQIAFETFVRPVLRQIAGRTSLHRSSLAATISEGWHSPVGKRQFIPVHVSGSPSLGYRAEPTTPPGTVRLHGLSEANAIAVVPEDTSTVVAGDTLHCLLLDA